MWSFYALFFFFLLILLTETRIERFRILAETRHDNDDAEIGILISGGNGTQYAHCPSYMDNSFIKF